VLIPRWVGSIPTHSRQIHNRLVNNQLQRRIGQDSGAITLRHGRFRIS
jgi:hypothetical protein